MLVPLAAAGDETRLKLFMPRATASELKLTVPVAEAVAKVSEGATLLPAVAAKSGGTELDAVGLGGDFQLAWHKPRPHPTEQVLVLEAAGTVLAQAGPPGHVRRGDPLRAKLRCPVRPIHRAFAAGDDPCAYAGRRQWLHRDARRSRRQAEGPAVVGRSAFAEDDDRAGGSPPGLPSRLRPVEGPVVVRTGRFRGRRRGPPVGRDRRGRRRRLAGALGNHAAMSVRPTSCPKPCESTTWWPATSMPPNPIR